MKKWQLQQFASKFNICIVYLYFEIRRALNLSKKSKTKCFAGGLGSENFIRW